MKNPPRKKAVAASKPASASHEDALFARVVDIIEAAREGKTILEAWPEHSAGVCGYIEGRRLEINYNPPGGAAPVDRFG